MAKTAKAPKPSVEICKSEAHARQRAFEITAEFPTRVRVKLQPVTGQKTPIIMVCTPGTRVVDEHAALPKGKEPEGAADTKWLVISQDYERAKTSKAPKTPAKTEPKAQAKAKEPPKAVKKKAAPKAKEPAKQSA